MAQPTKKYLLIIDGNALLHRAWHAIPPLTTKSGQLVHGAYGFTTIMLGAIREFKPAFVAVTFDLAGKTFRHEEYEAYKATREKKPDELYAQIPVIERILSAMEIPVYTAKGFEADDVIGTIARLANEKDPELHTVIVTGDLDTLQLIDDRTKVFTMRKGMSDTVLYDAKAVRERYGLRPEQMIDYKALRGDPSDNIPGVKGIGEKTATGLLTAFKTLDKLYESLEKNDKRFQKLRPAVKEKLIAHKKEAFQAYGLCTIRRDVPLDFILDACRYAPVTREKVADIFEELQFSRLLARLPEEEAEKRRGGEAEKRRGGEAEKRRGGEAEPQATLFGAAPEKTVVEFQMVANAKQLSDALSKMRKSATVAFRSMVEKEDPVAPIVTAFALSDGEQTFVIDGRLFREGAASLKRFFADSTAEKACHDLKREHTIFAANGMEIRGRVFDVMIASYLLHSGERRHTLEAILTFHRNVPSEPKKITEMTDEERNVRLALETRHLPALAKEMEGALSGQKLEHLNATIELPLAGVLASMERTGIAIDAAYFKKLSTDMGKKIVRLSKKIIGLAGEDFNINSPAQMKTILFERLQISTQGIKKTAKGAGLSTAAAELEKLKGAHPIIDEILEYRELAKLKSTYIDAIPALAHPKTGRVHASFNQTVTATGRLSSSDPNMQNIPSPDTEHGKDVRNGFVASKGMVLLAADYSQFELRIAAHIAEEKPMIDAFRKGEDIHRHTAVEMFGEQDADAKRRLAKVINFGILYGMGPQRLSESAGISFMEAREYIDRYFSVHKGISAYVEKIKERVRTIGHVETLMGRKRWFRNYALMNKREQAEAERQAINMPIQGTQADILKLVMVKLNELILASYGGGVEAPVRILLQVHDELIFEVKESLLEEFILSIRPIMEDAYPLSVPVVVNFSVGKRWGDMEKIKQ